MRHVTSAASLTGGTYSHAVVDGDRVYVSGQIAADWPGGGGPGDIESETRTCMELLGAILDELSLGFGDVAQVRVFMTDLREFDRMDAVYATFLEPGRAPARTCVGVAEILSGCRIEIDCVARRRSGS
jgi:2-iminobutanoate/2-iminopropanoate deaminase